jgi:hypothetical protein
MYVCSLDNINPHLLTTAVTFRSIFGYHYKVLGVDRIRGANEITLPKDCELFCLFSLFCMKEFLNEIFCNLL